MALEATDLLVVQKQSGAQEIRKASIQALSDYLQSSDTVVYKGLANFTVAGEEPGTRNIGDLYINNAVADGTWDWSANSGGVTDVSPGDRCLWNGTNWDIIQSGVGDAGVETVTGTLPIEIGGDTANPNVEIRSATTTLSGAVTRLATDADVHPDTGSGSTEAVVTADLLKQTNIDLAAATSGGVTSVRGVDPISVETDDNNGNAGTVNSPVIVIEDAASDQKGAVQLFDKDIVIADPVDSADYATWINTLDAAKAMTLQATAQKFVWQDFSGLAEA